MKTILISLKKLGIYLPFIFFCLTMSSIYSIYMSTFMIPYLINQNDFSPPKNTSPLLFMSKLTNLSKSFYYTSYSDIFSNSMNISGLILCFILHYNLLFFIICFYRTMNTVPGLIVKNFKEKVYEELNDFDNKNVEYFSKSKKKLNKSYDLSNDQIEIKNIIERNAYSVIEEEKSEESQIEIDENKLVELENQFLEMKGLRWCNHCQNLKPPRAHHCKQCNYCVLKMDHHCPWIVNCIGFYNYKFFILMIFYGDVSLFIMFFSYFFCLKYYVFLDDVDFFSLFIVELLFFGMAVFCFLITTFFFFHLYLICNNKTTIENAKEKGKKFKINGKYNLGCKKNFIGIFGENIFLWFFPISIHSQEAGYEFQTNK